MIRAFQKFLVSLNPTSGQRSWWLVWGTGMILLIGWLAAALPWIDSFTGSMVGIGRYGNGAITTMLAYGVELPARTADYYFLAVLFGIAIVKIGWILINVGGSFARGYKYRFAPGMGILGGDWYR